MPQDDKLTIAYLNNSFLLADELERRLKGECKVLVYEHANDLLQQLEHGTHADVILSSGNLNQAQGYALVNRIRQSEVLKYIPFVFVTDIIINNIRRQCVQAKVSEVFPRNFVAEDFLFRLNYLVDFSKRTKDKHQEEVSILQQFHLSSTKRLMDIILATSLLILLSPLIILLAIAIKLSSKGPLFYASPKVGMGYTLFNAYRFRTMYADKPKRKNNHTASNQNSTALYNEALCSECIEREVPCQTLLFKDGAALCEKHHKNVSKDFESIERRNKIMDERTTPIGRFLRRTHLVDLPKLYNVLKGDMSMVGNRPLSAREAELITTDKHITRFMAPVGITGLWRLFPKNTGEEQIIIAEVHYAENQSILEDRKILWQTLWQILFSRNK